MTALPPREQVPVELTWDLSAIYHTLEDWERDVVALDADMQRVTAFRGRLAEGADTLLACLEARDALLERLGRVTAYAQLYLATDGAAARNQALASRAAAVAAQVGQAQAFVSAELASLPVDVLEGYVSERTLAGYHEQLDDILRQRAHLLSEETEAALAALSEALDAPAALWQVATTVDLCCDPVPDASGRETPVSIATYVFGHAQSNDRALRRASHISLAQGLARHGATLATNLATHIRRNVTLARLRGYESAIDMMLDRQHVPVDLYDSVLDVIHDEIAPHVRRLTRLRQRVLGLDRVYRYDLDAPLDPGYDAPVEFDEAARLIRDGLRPLGVEYGRIVDAAFEDRWIDRCANQGKRSGAFCRTVYGVHPYVFTTWQDTLRSTFILAHELGHAGHGVLAGRRQTISNVRPTLFAIEAPSTTNELLLGRHILDTSDDPLLRRSVILQLIGTFTHNMVTHLLEAHFERALYNRAESREALTPDKVKQTQQEVFERFYGDTVVITDDDCLYWAQQPHFYVNLYPYTYAAGLSCGYGVMEAITRDGQPAIDRWLQALEAGGTLPPLEVMRVAGVEMSNPTPLRRAVAYFGTLVDELERGFTNTTA